MKFVYSLLLLVAATCTGYELDSLARQKDPWTLESSHPVPQVICKQRMYVDADAAESFSVNQADSGWLAISAYNINVPVKEFNAVSFLIKRVSGNDPLKIVLEAEGTRFVYKQMLTSGPSGGWQSVLLKFSNFINWESRTTPLEQDRPITKFSISLSKKWGDNEFIIRGAEFIKADPDAEDLFDKLKLKEAESEREAIKKYTDRGDTNLAVNAAVRVCKYSSQLSSRNIYPKAVTDGIVDRDQHAGVAFRDSLEFFIYLPYTKRSMVDGLILMTAKKIRWGIEVYSLAVDGEMQQIGKSYSDGYFHDIDLKGTLAGQLFIKAVPFQNEDLPGLAEDSHIVGNILLEAAVYGKALSDAERLSPGDFSLITPGNYTTNEQVIVMVPDHSGVADRLSAWLRVMSGNREVFSRNVQLSSPETEVDLSKAIGGKPGFYDLTCQIQCGEGTLNVLYAPLAVGELSTSAVHPNRTEETNSFSVYIGLPWGKSCIENYVHELAGLGVRHLVFVTDADKVNVNYSGVFDWSGFEQALDCAGSNNMKAVCKIWNTEAGIPVSWADEDMLDQTGKPPRNRFTRTRGGHFPSFFSSRYRNSLKRLIRNGINRFEENDTLSGWAFCLGDLEIFYPEYMYPHRDDKNLDNTLGAVIYDYSELSRQHFIKYLRDVRRFSLADINTRWNCSYTDWNAVRFPNYTGYDVLDVRLWWADFSDFRMYTIMDLAEDMYGCIRDTGTGKDIYTYILEATPAMEELAELSVSYNIKGLGSLSEPAYSPIFNALLRHTGVEYHPEPAQTPPNPNLFFGGLYQLFTWGGNWGYSYVGFGRKRTTDEANYPYFEKTGEIMHRLLGCEPKENAPLALYSLYTQMHTTKSFIWGNVYHPDDFLRRMNREHLFFDFVSDMSSSELIDYSRHQVVFDLSSRILPETVLQRLSDFVSQGGTLMATSKSFQYCREHPEDAQMAWNFFGLDQTLSQQTFYPKISVQLTDSAFDMGGVGQVASGSYISDASGLEVLGRYTNGKPAVVRWSFGQGKVILLLADIDYEKNPGFLTGLYELAGGTRMIDCNSDVFRVSLKHNPDTDRFYILVQSWFGREVLTETVTAKLPAGNYSVTELFSGEKTRISSASLSRNGLQVTLNPGYMKIYECIPE